MVTAGLDKDQPCFCNSLNCRRCCILFVLFVPMVPVYRYQQVASSTFQSCLKRSS